MFTGGFIFSHTASYQKAKDKLAGKIKAYSSPSKNITVIFLDISDSDTGKAWISHLFRQQFINAVNTGLTRSEDILAAYLIHGKTKDAQPFWTNYPLSSHAKKELNDSASVIASGIERARCVEAFDSLVAQLYSGSGHPIDSMLTEMTDVFGALQQAALYFRHTVIKPNDTRCIFLLSDTKENAGFAPGNIKLNNIGSIDTAKWLARIAMDQIRTTTDIGNDLKHAEVYILSPNNRLYYNEERNLRRIFWENLLVEKLHCRKLNFF